MNITIVGTGYVGLVTGVTLANIGHYVMCMDVDRNKIETMKKGIIPIYEPGLKELMIKNIKTGRLRFSSDYREGFATAEVIYIAVGTPQKQDGAPELKYVEDVACRITEHITSKMVVVIKSTVPIGTNHYIRELISKKTDIPVELVSNPEFLREGSAIYDTFNSDRIVIGADNEEAAAVIEEINKPFDIPIYKTDILSAEMIKYAANAFLVTKISFINEISNMCEKLGANIDDVAHGIGMDKRIGSQFLNAGIGYGGSCFPKDTSALVQIAESVGHDFSLLKEVMNVNRKQQEILLNKAIERFGSLEGKRVALLGMAFKPNTDDVRGAASIVVSQLLIDHGAQVVAYDPIAVDQAKMILPKEIEYVGSVEDVLKGADVAFILTEWDEFKQLDLTMYRQLMNQPVVFDGRNCYELDKVRDVGIEYHSIGRPTIDKVK